jgi:AraC-like DNA-binding protein
VLDPKRHGIAVEFFSTQPFAPRDRHEAWATRLWPSVAPLFESRPIGDFHNEAATVDLGSLKLFYSDISAQTYERSADMLRSHDPEALNVLLMLDGVAKGEAGDRPFEQTPGTVLVGDVAQTSRHISTGGRTVRLVLPRAQALEMGFDMRAMHGLVLDSQAAGLFAQHVSQVPRLVPELRAEDGPRVARTILDLLALAVSVSGRIVPPDPATRRSIAAIRARDEIERRLGSSALNVDHLCRCLGISRTSLQRLFEEEGGVGTYIRRRRLEAVRRALADPHNRETIAALADRWGFSDAAHLSRRFRAHYGSAPSDYRAAVRA